jgi:hypothetical protein
LNDITVDLLDDFSDGKNAQNCPWLQDGTVVQSNPFALSAT